MFPYVLQAIVRALATLWAILTISFFCLYQLPGDPARMILGPQASAGSVAAFRKEAGLDRSLEQQYIGYISRAARLNLGYSFALGKPVSELIVQRAPASLILLATATLFVALGGFLLPLIFKSIGSDRFLWLYALIVQTVAFVPSYVLAILSLIMISGWLGWLPILFDPSQLKSWALAGAVLSAYPSALLLRVFVGRLEAELATAYVRRARALGFSYAHIVWREALPNAIPAALAVLANSIAFFITGAFFVEVVFGVPGLGRLAQEGIRQKDVAVLGGICLVYSSFVILLSLLLNVAQRLLSPKRLHLHAE